MLDSPIGIYKRSHAEVNPYSNEEQNSVGSDLDNQQQRQTADGKILVTVANILPNGQVCFANTKLERTVPENPVHARHFIDIINTYIKFLNHKYQEGTVRFRYV